MQRGIADGAVGYIALPDLVGPNTGRLREIAAVVYGLDCTPGRQVDAFIPGV